MSSCFCRRVLLALSQWQQKDPWGTDVNEAEVTLATSTGRKNNPLSVAWLLLSKIKFSQEVVQFCSQKSDSLPNVRDPCGKAPPLVSYSGSTGGFGGFSISRAWWLLFSDRLKRERWAENVQKQPHQRFFFLVYENTLTKTSSCTEAGGVTVMCEQSDLFWKVGTCHAVATAGSWVTLAARNLKQILKALNGETVGSSAPRAGRRMFIFPGR